MEQTLQKNDSSVIWHHFTLMAKGYEHNNESTLPGRVFCRKGGFCNFLVILRLSVKWVYAL